MFMFGAWIYIPPSRLAALIARGRIVRSISFGSSDLLRFRCEKTCEKTPCLVDGTLTFVGLLLVKPWRITTHQPSKVPRQSVLLSWRVLVWTKSLQIVIPNHHLKCKEPSRVSFILVKPFKPNHHTSPYITIHSHKSPEITRIKSPWIIINRHWTSTN